jgi:hypothetical protein
MVDEDYRGRGIGKEIVRRVIQYHTDGECRGIILWTQDVLIPAYPMYRKFGFRIAARRVFYRFQLEATASNLSVETCTEAFAEQTENLQREWMQVAFPVGVENMKPTGGNWWVVSSNGQPVGYFHMGKKDDLPLLSQVVSRLSDAPDVFDAISGFLEERGHKEAIWQTCVDSIWEEELEKHELQDSQLTPHIRMCLPIGALIDTHEQRPEFDGCSTW